MFIKFNLVLNFKFNILNYFFFFNIIFLDKFNIIFILVILLVRFFIIYYNYLYLNDNYYSILILFFVFIILILLIRINLIIIILWWDLLGLISFLLVIYYNNYIIIKIRILIILFNRLGDIFILIIIFNFFSLMNLNLITSFNKINLILLFLRLILKSSQFPLNLWLTKAIIAPLPVSSLVHSSTLVTVGIYFIFRFLNYFYLNFIIFFFFSTLIYYGFLILYVYDIKKLIALSTINNLSLIIFFLYLNIYIYIYIYILIHAIFKSIIFLCVGLFIYNNYDIQDSRLINLIINIDYILFFYILIRELICCGLLFFRIFICKDIFFDLFYLIKIRNFFFFFFFFFFYFFFFFKFFF